MAGVQLTADCSELRRTSLSKWENEGGAIKSSPCETDGDRADLSNTELVQLRIRVIALENVIIAVLAEGSDRQRRMAVEMAAQISPRPGFTQHPLTIQAASHITDLVHRADHFREMSPPTCSEPKQ